MTANGASGCSLDSINIALINGSLHGDSDNSNTLMLLRLAERELLKRGAEVTLISPELVQFSLGNQQQSMYVLDSEKVIAAIQKADGIIISSGSHWGQSSSTSQKFIEDATPTEGTSAWLGKPVGIIISEHSTGGQAILSNLMLTLNNYGALIPPQAGMVFSRSGQEAKKRGEQWAEDVWGPDDIGSICDKIVVYAKNRNVVKLESWPVDHDSESFHSRWVKLRGTARQGE
jgi:multimeric flavodoxin WrbA